MIEKTLSVHDSLLVGYEVDGLRRTIVLHTQPHGGGGEAFIDVRFDGISAYRFEDDMLQNIVFDVTDASAIEFASIVEELAEGYPKAGVPRGWDERNETVEHFFERVKLRLFVLSSSYGMTGWVAAASMAYVLRSVPRSPEERSHEIESAIRAVLMSDWDPIGVKDVPEAQDEYDSYVGGVYRLLASRAEAEQIAAHLAQVETTMMGLPATPHQRIGVAQKLKALDVSLYQEPY